MGAAIMHRKKRARTGQTSEIASNQTPKKSPQAPPPLSNLNIHDCSFLKWPVSPITSVAISPSGRYLAVARSASIELRDRDTIWAPLARTYADTSRKSHTISSIKFSTCGNYLLAGRLDGVLFVYRVGPHSLELHVRLHPDGGAIWDIDVCQDDPQSRVRIAVACDDGCVRVLSRDPSAPSDQPPYPSASEFYIVRVCESNLARALSVSWAPSAVGGLEGCVVCGDAEGGVRWLNATSGSLYGRGKIPSLRREPVLIWTISFVSGGRQVVCGDSRGMVSVWSTATNTMTVEMSVEGLTGTIWSSLRVSLPTSGDIVLLGSAGGGVGGIKSHVVDEGVVQWLPVRGTRLHSHDVRSMSCTADGLVVSGSMDARCTLFKPSDLIEKNKMSWIYPHMEGVGQSAVQFVSERGLVLSRYEKCLEFWSLSDKVTTPTLELKMKLKSFKSDVKTCAISQDCQVIVASSEDSFRIYDVPCSTSGSGASGMFGKVKLRQISALIESRLRGGIDMAFCGSTLWCISRSGGNVLALKNDEIISFSKEEIGSGAYALHKIACHAGRVAVCDTSGSVFIAGGLNDVSVKSDVKWAVLFAQKSDAISVSALQFSQSGKQLAIATRDFRLYVLGTDKTWDGEQSHRHSFPSLATSLSFSNDENSLLVSGRDFCHIVGIQGRTVEKRKSEEREVAPSSAHVLPCRKMVLGSAVLGRSNAIIVHRPWKLVQESLPDAIVKKPYGT